MINWSMMKSPQEILMERKESALSSINSSYEREFLSIKSQYPDSERESWPVQLAESSAIEKDPHAYTPFLSALCQSRGFGESVFDLAQKVRNKNATYSDLSSYLTGKRHRIEKQILEASSIEEIDLIIW